MTITARMICILLAAVAACASLAAWTYSQLPQAEAMPSLFGAIIETSSFLLGALVAGMLFYAERAWSAKAERKAQAAENERIQRRVQWALRRISVEVIDAVENAELLAEDAGEWSLSLLADDVWLTSRDMLGVHMECGPMHYALTDFYKRLRVLQIADSKRLDYVLTHDDPTEALHIVQRQAGLVIEAGERTLELLRTKGDDVVERINRRLEHGPTFAETAHRNAVEQAEQEQEAA